MVARLMAKSIIAMTLLFIVQPASAVVPRSVNYQGRLTDAGGTPLTGAYNMTFAIYDAPVAGATLYTSGIQSVTVTNGLFEVQIGAPPMPAMSVALFADTARYLGVTVGGDPELTPRTKLNSLPYAFQVQTVNGATGGDVSGTTNFTSSANTRASITPSTSTIATYGSDNLEQVRLWGNTWGEVLLYDSDGSNDNTVRLGAQTSLGTKGGVLELNNDNGSPNISFNAGLTGNGSVVLPNSAISSLESFDEPGVANNTDAGTTLTGVTTLISRFITVPSDGYVLAIGSGSIDGSHASGTFTTILTWITDSSGGLSTGKPQVTWTISGNAPTGSYASPFCVQGIFSVTAGIHGFYLRSVESSTGGGFSGYNSDMTLIFIPTAYGTIVSHKTGTQGDQPDVVKSKGVDSELSARLFDEQRLANEVAELKRQLAEIRAMLGSTSQTAVEVDQITE